MAKPILALAAKNCAVILQAKPTNAIRINIQKHFQIALLLFCAIPVSIIFAITTGTSKSKNTSSSLNKGARILSFVYSFK